MVPSGFSISHCERPRLLAAVPFGLVLLGLLFFGLEAILGQPPPSAPPTFVVHTIDGPVPAGTLEKLDEDWSIQLGGKTPRALAGTDWVSLRREGARLPPFPTKNCVLLTTGDRIRVEAGALFRLEEERLFVRPEKGTEISIPLAFLAYFCVRIPEGVDDPAQFLARMENIKRPRDILYLKGGDRIEGALVSPARGPVYTMNLGDRSVATPLDQIAILAVSTELQARPKTKKTFAHVVTIGGARLQFSGLRLDSRRRLLAGKTLFGANLDIPLEEIAALSIRHGQADYLSDLILSNYQHTPFLGVKWPLVPDGTVSGRQLSLGDDYFDKGLGTHTQSQVTYSLGGSYRRFEASVGIEEGTGQSGHAKISVTLDGRPVVFRKDLPGRGAILPLRLDVRKARAITLSVEYGDFGDVQGRVNWIDARLIREGK
jgi:hypothetical protein